MTVTILESVPLGTIIDGFEIHCLSNGPADGKTQVQCVAHQSIQGMRHSEMEPDETLFCGLIAVDAKTSRYHLTVFDQPTDKWHQNDQKYVAKIGGLTLVWRCDDPDAIRITGSPDGAAFDPNKEGITYHRKMPR
jgi:hypothetical protein